MRTARSLLIITVLVGAAACGAVQPTSDSGTIAAVATTTIVGDLVAAVGGGDIELVTLMGPGVDPHLYKPSAGDVRRMSGARVVFLNGLHLEGKMGEVLGEMGQRGVTVVAIAECLPEAELIVPEGGSAGLPDPHIWFDVALWSRAAECARDALIEIDPENADGYRAREEQYRARLEELDAWVRERVVELPPEQRVLVTAHDAFSYFGRAYGFEVRGLLGVSTASEAGTADVQRLADFIAERKVPAIFVESSVPPRYVEALRQAVIARGFDVSIGGSLYSDALGDPGGPAGTYAGTVRSNVDTIVGSLAGASGGTP